MGDPSVARATRSDRFTDTSWRSVHLARQLSGAV
jgi:hypothetical protein